MKYLLTFAILFSLISCSEKEFYSDDLKFLNLRKEVRYMKETIFKLQGSSERLEMVYYWNSQYLHYNSYAFSKQKYNEVTGVIGQNVEYFFNEDGEKIKQEYRQRDRTLIYHYQYGPDGINRITKEEEEFPNGDQRIKKEYSYKIDQKKCQLIRNETDTLLLPNCFAKGITPTEKKEGEEKYTLYDEQGRMIEKKELHSLLKFEYDNKDRLIKKITTGSGNRKEVLEHIYKEDKIIETKSYYFRGDNPNSVPVNNKTYLFDDFGNMISLTTLTKHGGGQKFKIDIKTYDENNNWVLANFKYGNAIFIIKREINYFD